MGGRGDEVGEEDGRVAGVDEEAAHDGVGERAKEGVRRGEDEEFGMPACRW